jgi:proline-specific peptidase
MHTQLPTREGFCSFRGHKTWYGIVGDRQASGKFPLLCLHGGPGATHDYLSPIAALAEGGRGVVFYDQLGSGNSDPVRGASRWTIDLFLEELGVVRRALGLDRVHLLGHSWGGQLALEYALLQPSGLASLVLADTLSSSTQWASEADRLRGELPPDVQHTLSKHENAGTTDSPAYQNACKVYYRRHGCLTPPRKRPPWLRQAFSKLDSNPEVYATMWGPSEFCVTGTLKNWDVTSRLGEIHVPTLVVGGRHDEATPTITETLQRGIPGSERVIFENSGHFPHIDETGRYLQVVGHFLDRVEAGALPQR